MKLCEWEGRKSRVTLKVISTRHGTNSEKTYSGEERGREGESNTTVGKRETLVSI